VPNSGGVRGCEIRIGCCPDATHTATEAGNDLHAVCDRSAQRPLNRLYPFSPKLSTQIASGGMRTAPCSLQRVTISTPRNGFRAIYRDAVQSVNAWYMACLVLPRRNTAMKTKTNLKAGLPAVQMAREA
jgi:hypothetical protein